MVVGFLKKYLHASKVYVLKTANCFSQQNNKELFATSHWCTRSDHLVFIYLSNELWISLLSKDHVRSWPPHAARPLGLLCLLCVWQEGKQAALAADFSVTQFKHLGRLLMVHGRNSYKRSAALSQFVIHRSLCISAMQVRLPTRCPLSVCIFLRVVAFFL